MKRGNQEHYKEYMRKYMNNRRNNDPDFRARQLASTKKYQQRERYKMFVTRTFYKHKTRSCPLLCTSRELEAMAKRTTECSICGATLSFVYRGKIGSNSNYPSVDIIDKQKPTTLDNLQIICVHCNMAKCEMNMEEFKEWIRKIHMRFEHVRI